MMNGNNFVTILLKIITSVIKLSIIYVNLKTNMDYSEKVTVK